jgi:pyridoxine 5-phosphate synthase
VQQVARLAQVRELNIGHYLIGEAILHGLPHAVRTMRALIASA